MPAIMADVHCEGHVHELLYVLLGQQWSEIWAALDVDVETFESLGLPRTAPDPFLWQMCQDREIVLITANRSGRKSNSLDVAIRTLNTAASLPVLTLANPDRILRDKAYAERAAERLLEILFDLDVYRGTGRLYIP